MFFASTEPSGCFSDAMMMIWAPGPAHFCCPRSCGNHRRRRKDNLLLAIFAFTVKV